MKRNTKTEILDVALRLFSEKGYAGTSMQDIADKLKITKPALYRHYASKEDIFESMMDVTENYYAEKFGSLENIQHLPLTKEELFEFSMNQINFTIADETIIMTRRFLTIEQFHGKRMGELATNHFLNGIKSMYEMIFEKMMEEGSMKKDDPSMLSLLYVSPVVEMIHMSDRQPEKMDYAKETIGKHITRFIDTYCI